MNFSQPKKIEEALSLLADDNWSILSGGTDFYPSGQNLGSSNNILDISKIENLASLSQGDHYWSIGALVTWSDLVAATLPHAFDALKQAGREVGSVQIQNRATVVGNICNASPAADGVPPLLSLDAKIRLSSKRGERTVSLDEFVLGNRKIDLKADEMVTHILIPKKSAQGHSKFLKLGARKYLVISIAMVAVRLSVDSDNKIEEAAVSVGSCSVVAKRLHALETALRGCSPSDDFSNFVENDHLADLLPIDDIRASAHYRLNAAKEMISRTITDVCATL